MHWTDVLRRLTAAEERSVKRIGTLERENEVLKAEKQQACANRDDMAKQAAALEQELADTKARDEKRIQEVLREVELRKAEAERLRAENVRLKEYLDTALELLDCVPSKFTTEAQAYLNSICYGKVETRRAPQTEEG